MSSPRNFFDRFWKPYLEYEATLGYGIQQQKEEIKYLDIKPGDTTINVGINWGHSINLIFQSCPEVKKVIAVDSSKMMLELSKRIFSSDPAAIQNLTGNLTPEGSDYVARISQQALQYRDRVSFLLLSAEELHTAGIVADNIAATMGYHWLPSPQSNSFISFNRSLKTNGKVTFSTASGLFETKLDKYSFTLSPYYRAFFEEIETLGVAAGIKALPALDYNDKFTLEEITDTIKKAGFVLENYREHTLSVPEKSIDKVCLAGIKFRYAFDGQEETIKTVSSEAFQRAKRRYTYSDYGQQLEISPIFLIQKNICV